MLKNHDRGHQTEVDVRGKRHASRDTDDASNALSAHVTVSASMPKARGKRETAGAVPPALPSGSCSHLVHTNLLSLQSHRAGRATSIWFSLSVALVSDAPGIP